MSLPVNVYQWKKAKLQLEDIKAVHHLSQFFFEK